MTINKFISNITSLDVKELSFISVSETKDYITDIQRDQMFKGLNAEGNRIGRYRNNKYARAKFSMNPIPGLGIPDLKLTGAFYAGFKTIVTQDIFSTSSIDSKNEALTQKYDPFGLDTDSKVEYAIKLRPVFIKNIKEKLQS